VEPSSEQSVLHRFSTSNTIQSEPAIATDVSGGWHAVDVSEAIEGERVELDFESDTGKHQHFSLTSLDTTPSERIAWIHFNEPGLLRIAATYSPSHPTLRGVGYAELMNKTRDLAFGKALLTVFFLGEVIPIGAWILLICSLQGLTSWAISKLPREVRTRAAREVHLLLAVTKWVGVAAYVAWTVKDLLVGLGVASVL